MAEAEAEAEAEAVEEDIDMDNSGYKQAVALMQRGADTDELVDACDLSRGELDLLSRLQSSVRDVRKKRAA